jgi:WD40 repeat protein
MFMLPRQRDRIRHLAFSPCGLTLAAVVRESDRRIIVWDLVKREPVSLLHPSEAAGDGLVFVRDDATLVIEPGPGQDLLLLDLSTKKTRPLLDRGDGTFVSWAAVAAEGETVVVASVSWAGKARLLSIDVWQAEVSTRRKSRLAQFGLTSPVLGLAVRPGKPVVLAVKQGLPFRVALLTPGHPPNVIDLPRNAWVDSLAFAPDGGTLALKSLRRVRLWNVDDKRMGAEIVGPPTFHAVEFSPDGRTLGLGASDGVVRLCDVATGQQRAAYDWKIGPIQALAFAPDGMRAAAGGDEGTIVVWDVEG